MECAHGVGASASRDSSASSAETAAYAQNDKHAWCSWCEVLDSIHVLQNAREITMMHSPLPHPPSPPLRRTPGAPRSTTRTASRGLALAVVVVAIGSWACAGEKCWWPPDKPATTAAPARARGVSGWFMRFYRDYLSQVDGMRTCRFEPTCGGYARQAIRRHGALLGWIMGCERSIRYHGDTTTYPRAVSDGHLRLLDPVSDSDWWFRHPFRRRQP